MSCWSPCNDGIAAEQACESPDGLVPHVAPGAHFGPPREPRRSVTGKASAPGNRSARSTAERGLAPAERTPFPVNRGRQGSGPGEVDPISTHWTMARRRHRAECGILLRVSGNLPPRWQRGSLPLVSGRRNPQAVSVLFASTTSFCGWELEPESCNEWGVEQTATAPKPGPS